MTCRCTNERHDNHAGRSCEEPATTSDAYCDICHKKAADEWAGTQQSWTSNVQQAVFAAHGRSRMAAVYASTMMSGTPMALQLSEAPSVFLQTVIVPASAASEGKLIEAVALPWFEIIDLILKDPAAIYQIDPFKWEEIIAGAWTRAGFDEVILTPRSNDQGRDVIASTRGVGSVRFFDQVKAYGPGHRVQANDVRALIGVLNLEPNVSKGIVTTTSEFAPGIYEDENIKRFMPHRLELKPRQALLDWLQALAARKP